jgi:hypothetical protein
MLRNRDVDWLLEDLCAKGGYCLSADVNVRLRNAPPDTPQKFAEAVIRAEGLDPTLDRREFSWVLEVVERAFRRSASVTSNER